MATNTQTKPASIAGVANHSAAMLGTPTAIEATSQGLRRPPASAMAPSTGAPMATRMAPTALV